MIYELADERDLPAQARGEDLTCYLQKRPGYRHHPRKVDGWWHAVMTSFARDIAALFRPRDTDHMNEVGLDLTNYDAVRAAAAEISNRIKGIGGRCMPPPPDPPLTGDQMKLFDTWVTEGCPP